MERRRQATIDGEDHDRQPKTKTETKTNGKERDDERGWKGQTRAKAP